MADTQALDVYMNDHLAGSAAAVELVERIRDNNEGTDLARAMDSLLGDIEADQATLAAIMESLGVVPSSPKQAAGKVLETLSRFRLNERVTGSAEVSQLMELETLSLGIEGKLALWRSLGEVTGSLTGLGAFDLPTLAARAVSQRAVVEPFRLEAARAALA
jgi:hypothetical protein